MFQVNVNGAEIPQFVQAEVRGEIGAATWNIPEEVPVAFVYNRRNYAVMMATPSDLVDFAVGFSLTEVVIKSPGDIKSLDVLLSDKGADLRLKINPDALAKMDLSLRRRNMVGSASCGLCGLENADALFKVLPQVSEKSMFIDADVLKKSLKNLANHQPVNAATHSVHAAAWVSVDGEISMVREDVGRHNALDKLLGAMALKNQSAEDGFVLMSSRCSYEIVEKAARRGVKAILSISGPTNFALRKAKEANMAIYSRSGEGAVRLLT